MPRFAGGGRYRPQRITDERLDEELAAMEQKADEHTAMVNAAIAYGVITPEGIEPPLVGDAELLLDEQFEWPERDEHFGERVSSWMVFFREEPSSRTMDRQEERFKEARESGDVIWWEERPASFDYRA